MYPGEGRGPQKRGAAYAMAAKEGILFGHKTFQNWIGLSLISKPLSFSNTGSNADKDFNTVKKRVESIDENIKKNSQRRVSKR